MSMAKGRRAPPVPRGILPPSVPVYDAPGPSQLAYRAKITAGPLASAGVPASLLKRVENLLAPKPPPQPRDLSEPDGMTMAIVTSGSGSNQAPTVAGSDRAIVTGGGSAMGALDAIVTRATARAERAVKRAETSGADLQVQKRGLSRSGIEGSVAFNGGAADATRKGSFLSSETATEKEVDPEVSPATVGGNDRAVVKRRPQTAGSARSLSSRPLNVPPLSINHLPRVATASAATGGHPSPSPKTKSKRRRPATASRKHRSSRTDDTGGGNAITGTATLGDLRDAASTTQLQQPQQTQPHPPKTQKAEKKKGGSTSATSSPSSPAAAVVPKRPPRPAPTRAAREEARAWREKRERRDRKRERLESARQRREEALVKRSLATRPSTPRSQRNAAKGNAPESSPSRKGSATRYVSDPRAWRNLNRVSQGTRVFTIYGGAGNARPVRDALVERGWVQNTVPNSEVFDLKWCDYNGRVDWEGLPNGATINHFRGNGSLTTKAGLAASLDEVHWSAAVDKRSFFPDCTTVGTAEDTAAFLHTYRLCACECIVRLMVAKADWYAQYGAQGLGTNNTDDKDVANTDSEATDGSDTGGEEKSEKSPTNLSVGHTGDVERGPRVAEDPRFRHITTDLALLAARVLFRHLAVVEGGVPEDGNVAGDSVVSRWATEAEWSAITDQPVLFPRRSGSGEIAVAGRRVVGLVSPKRPPSSRSSPRRRPPSSSASMSMSMSTSTSSLSGALAQCNGRPGSSSSSSSRRVAVPPGVRPTGSAPILERVASSGGNCDGAGSTANTTGSGTNCDLGCGDAADNCLRGQERRPPPREVAEECRELLKRLSDGDPQWHVRGDRGAWIIKPIGKSRGRGIEVFQSLEDILAYIDGTQERYVAQKYIERPLIVAGRKFDFRLWVLVTAWNPLIAYKHDYYVRWCNDGYSLDSLADRTVHLANQAVQKHSTKYGTDLSFGDNLWDMETMRKWLDDTHGPGTADRIEARMSEIVLHTLIAVEHNIVDHKASMELLGYDLMLDDALNMWLIEVNETPSMDTGPEVLDSFVGRAVGDMCDFAFDTHTRRSPQTDQSVTGGWQLITDPFARRVPARVKHGVDLMCMGEKKTVHKVKTVPVA